MELPWCSFQVSLSSDLCVFTSLKALQTLSFWGFMEASLHRHRWLNHWPLAISGLSPLSGGQGGIVGGTESPNPLIPWQPAPTLGVGSKSHLPWSVFRSWGPETRYYPTTFITQEILRVLGSCEPGIVDEDQIYVFGHLNDDFSYKSQYCI